MSQATGLDEMIANLRGFAKSDFAADVAKEAAPAIERLARASAAAGTTPTGESWAPRKADGGRAMVNAAAAVSVKAIGGIVRIVLKGVDVFHHYGKGSSEPKRQVIIDGDVPASYAAELRAAAGRVFARAMGGR